MNGRGITATALFGLVTALAGPAVAETPPPLCEVVFPTPLAAHDPDSSLAFHGAALEGADNEPLVARNIIEKNRFFDACGDQPCEITGTPSHTVELPAFDTTRTRNRLRVRSFGDETHQGAERDFRHIDIGPLAELRLQPAGERWRIQQLRVSPAATLTLAPGDYWVEELQLAPSASLEVDGPGTVRLFVREDVSAGPRAHLNPGDDGDFTDSEQLLLVGYGDLRLGPMARAAATLYAVGDIRLGFGARVRGDLAGNRVLLGLGARVDAVDEAAREARDAGNFCLYEIPPPVIELDGEEPDTTQGSSYTLSGTITAGTRWYPVTEAAITGGALDAPRDLELDQQGGFSETIPLVWGENRLRVTAADEKANQAEAIRTVERIDPDPPTLTLDNPADDIISTEAVTVSGRAEDAHSGVATITIRGGDGDPVSPAPDSDGAFSIDIPLTVGQHEFTITVLDHYGNDTVETIRVYRTDPPELQVDNPDTATVTENAVQVTGIATDDLELAEVLVRNARYGSAFSATVADDGTFSATVPLRLDDNPLTVIARDIVDNTTEHAITVTRLSPPELGQLSPADGAVLHADQVTLAGRIATDLPIERLQLTVNGSRVMVGTDDAPGHPFQVPGMPLRWGGNHFTLRVDSPHGTDQRELSLSRLPEDEDSVPAPAVELLTPADGERVSGDSVAVAGRVTSHAGRASVQVNGQPVSLSGGGTDGRFDTRVNFPEGEDSLGIQAVATDALDRQSSTSVTVHRDSTGPVIRLTPALAPAPEDNPVRESPYRLTGTVTDEHLAGLLINNGPVTLEATAEPGEYRFHRAIPLTAGEHGLSLEAFDDAGNRTREHYRLSLDPSALLEAVLPAPNSRFTVQNGEAPQTPVVARLDGQAPGATAVAIIDDRETTLSLDGSLVEGEVELPAEDGDHDLLIQVRHEGDLVAGTRVPITVVHREQQPLRLVRMEPEAHSDFVSPGRTLAFHFNRPVDPEALDIDVRETLHGETYVNPDPPGADFLRAQGHQVETVHRSQEPVPGTLDIIRGRRAALFVPDRFFGFGATVRVEVSHGGESLARKQITIEPMPTQVTGSVSDQFGQPAADVPVVLGGLRTRTGEDGGFTFGFGDGAGGQGRLGGGEQTLVINPDMQDPRFGSRRQSITLREGRHNRLGVRAVPLINEATGFTQLRSGQRSVLANGRMEIDLRNAVLRTEGGDGRVAVNPQFTGVERLGLQIAGPAPVLGVYALQPEGLGVRGEPGLSLAVPSLEGRRDWIADGTPVLLIGLNAGRTALVPVGAGEVNGETVELQGDFQGEWIDYLGVALPTEDARPVIRAWLDGEGSWSAVLAAMPGGQ